MCSLQCRNACKLCTNCTQAQGLPKNTVSTYLTWGSLLLAPDCSLPLPTFPPVAYPPALDLRAVFWPHRRESQSRRPKSQLQKGKKQSSGAQTPRSCWCIPVEDRQMWTLFLNPEAALFSVGWTQAGAEQSRLARMPEGESWALPFCCLFFKPHSLCLSSLPAADWKAAHATVYMWTVISLLLPGKLLVTWFLSCCRKSYVHRW